MVENSRIDILYRLVTLEIKDYDHRGNQKMKKDMFNIIARPRELFTRLTTYA